MATIPCAIHCSISSSSAPSSLHRPLARLRSPFLAFTRNLGCRRSSRLMERAGLAGRGGGARCWFKFGSRGVDAEGAGIYGSQSRDDFDRDDVEQLVGRLDNSAVSAAGAKLAFKSNEEIAVQVRTVPLDEVISEKEKVVLIKIDVQGWELHVLQGATKLLSRTKAQSPYLIYEEDERLLAASNSSSREIRDFLRTLGYDRCSRHGTDAHCTKS